MKKSDKIFYVINKLEELYPTVPVPLNHKDPYTLLVAGLLSAQCTDKRVNQITPKLFKLADNPSEMVKLTVEEIKEIIRPCGLSPMKSKGIHGLSEIIIKKHNGIFYEVVFLLILLSHSQFLQSCFPVSIFELLVGM